MRVHDDHFHTSSSHLLPNNLRRSNTAMRSCMARRLYMCHVITGIEVVDDFGNCILDVPIRGPTFQDDILHLRTHPRVHLANLTDRGSPFLAPDCEKGGYARGEHSIQR